MKSVTAERRGRDFHSSGILDEEVNLYFSILLLTQFTPTEPLHYTLPSGNSSCIVKKVPESMAAGATSQQRSLHRHDCPCGIRSRRGSSFPAAGTTDGAIPLTPKMVRTDSLEERFAGEGAGRGGRSG